jgi:hypothetical protein
MTDGHIRRWALLGALVSTALLTAACDRKMPKEGSNYEGVANEAQNVETPGSGQQDGQPPRLEPGIGGSGEQQQQDAAQVNDANLNGQKQAAQPQQQAIGAPGYSSPRENPQVSPVYVEPQPQLRESGGAGKAEQRLKMPNAGDKAD